ncbi:MAG: glycosyltransferase [Candidatus Anstonellales archaeon]
MVFYLCLGRHPVYQAIHLIASHIKNGPVISVDCAKNLRYIYRGKTFHIQMLDILLSKSDIYCFNSPLIELKAWEALFKKVPMILVEEYYEKNWLKDLIVSFLLLPFKNCIFIALTKRTYYFLKKRGFMVFLIPPADKKRKITKKRKYILFVGRLCASKNPQLVVDLAKKIKDEHFIIIGRGPLSHFVEKASRELPNLKYIPYIKQREKLFDYYSEAKLLIHPAFKDPVGFVVIEALSTGTPTLVSAFTGASDYLPENWVLDDLSSQKWAEKIREIVKNLSVNVAVAERTFDKEHLNLDDIYFNEVAKNIKVTLTKISSI